MNYRRLDEIATIYNGNSINKAEKQQKYMHTVPGWNYIGTKDVDFDGKVTYKNGVVIPFSESRFKIAPAGTVFVCSEGGSAGRKTAIINEDVCFGNKLFAIVNSKKLFVEKYVYYYTRFGDFTKQFKLLASTLMGGISAKNFGSIVLPLPSIPEQERIVTRIEELFSELDKAVESLQTIKQQLAVYRQAVLKALLTNDKWREYLLGDVVTTEEGDRGKNYPKRSDYTSKGHCLFLSAQNIRSYGWCFDDTVFLSKGKHEQLHGGTMKKGDIVITTRGTLGNVAVFDETVPYNIIRVNSCMLILRCNTSLVSPHFLSKFIMTPMFRRLINQKKTGTAQPQIPANQLRELKISIPPLEEQAMIVTEIESRLSVCDSIERTVDTALAQAGALRQSILKQAFEGGLV